MASNDVSIHEEQVNIDEILHSDDNRDNDGDAEGDNEIEDGELIEEILADFNSGNECCGPKLHDKIQKILSCYMKSAKILPSTLEKLKEVKFPEGCDFLVPTRVNDSIYPLLAMQHKRDNSEMVKVESAITKSTVVQGRVMETLLNMRRHLPPSQSDSVKSLIKDLAASTEILSFGRTKLNSLRRDTVVRSLNPEFRSLISNTSPGDGFLFGGDLSEVLKNIDTNNRLTARLSLPSRKSADGPTRAKVSSHQPGSFLGRGQAPPFKRKSDNNNRYARTYGNKRRTMESSHQQPPRSPVKDR